MDDKFVDICFMETETPFIVNICGEFQFVIIEAIQNQLEDHEIFMSDKSLDEFEFPKNFKESLPETWIAIIARFEVIVETGDSECFDEGEMVTLEYMKTITIDKSDSIDKQGIRYG